MKTFGKALQLLMHERGLDDPALAILCHKSPSTINRLRRDLTEPRRDTIIDIARALRLSPLELFDFNNEFLSSKMLASANSDTIMRPMTTELFCQLHQISDPYVIILIDRLIQLNKTSDKLTALVEIQGKIDLMIAAESRSADAFNPAQKAT